MQTLGEVGASEQIPMDGVEVARRRCDDVHVPDCMCKRDLTVRAEESHSYHVQQPPYGHLDESFHLVLKCPRNDAKNTAVREENMVRSTGKSAHNGVLKDQSR